MNLFKKLLFPEQFNEAKIYEANMNKLISENTSCFEEFYKKNFSDRKGMRINEFLKLYPIPFGVSKFQKGSIGEIQRKLKEIILRPWEQQASNEKILKRRLEEEKSEKEYKEGQIIIEKLESIQLKIHDKTTQFPYVKTRFLKDEKVKRVCNSLIKDKTIDPLNEFEFFCLKQVFFHIYMDKGLILPDIKSILTWYKEFGFVLSDHQKKVLEEEINQEKNEIIKRDERFQRLIIVGKQISEIKKFEKLINESNGVKIEEIPLLDLIDKRLVAILENSTDRTPIHYLITKFRNGGKKFQEQRREMLIEILDLYEKIAIVSSVQEKQNLYDFIKMKEEEYQKRIFFN